jgi:hypothetical protein
MDILCISNNKIIKICENVLQKIGKNYSLAQNIPGCTIRTNCVLLRIPLDEFSLICHYL